MEMDGWVTTSFARLVDQVTQRGLGERLFAVAAKGKHHEDTVRDAFAEALATTTSEAPAILRNKKSMPWAPQYRPDISVLREGRMTAVVEVKCPMTNHDGISNKTEKPEHLKKDAASLVAGLRGGARGAYELVGLFEAYGLVDGRPVPPDGRRIGAYEAFVKSEFRIQWPTLHNYSHKAGEAKVDETLQGLGLRRIRGWRRMPLPGTRNDVSAFLDLGLFKVVR